MKEKASYLYVMAQTYITWTSHTPEACLLIAGNDQLLV